MGVEILTSRACRTLGLLVVLASASLGHLACVEQPTMRLNHAEVAGLAVSLPPSVGVLLRGKFN